MRSLPVLPARVRGHALAVALALVVLPLAACGSDAKSSDSTTSGSTSSTSSGSTSSPAGTVPSTVFFVRDEKSSTESGEVRTKPVVGAARAHVEEGKEAAGLAAALLAGPDPAAEAAGLRSELPTGAAGLSIAVAGSTATVDVPGALSSPTDAPTADLRLAQIVFTATELPGVTSVRILVDGAPVTDFAGTGRALPATLTRADFADVTPKILLTSPLPGDLVTPTFHVTGSATVFEATFELTVTGGDGKELAKQTVTATAGAPETGTFDTSVKVTVSGTTPATLAVAAASPVDGTPQFSVRLPITIAP